MQYRDWRHLLLAFVKRCQSITVWLSMWFSLYKLAAQPMVCCHTCLINVAAFDACRFVGTHLTFIFLFSSFGETNIDIRLPYWPRFACEFVVTRSNEGFLPFKYLNSIKLFCLLSSLNYDVWPTPITVIKCQWNISA